VAAAVKAALRVTDRIPAEIDLETARVHLDVDGVHVEIATSPSHPGYVIVVITDTTGEDQIWRIPTRAKLAREFLGARP
jgi:hypothetical protein